MLKDFTEFYQYIDKRSKARPLASDSKTCVRSHCKLCIKELQRSKYGADLARYRKQSRMYVKLNPIARRRTYLKSKYNMTLEEYEILFLKQNLCCAICLKHTTRPCVDHCHKSGKIRGILCPKCNVALGYFMDDPKLMERASRYIRENFE